jgi:hypothetical protein
MKIKLHWLFISVALIACTSGLRAQIPVFPVTTNAANFALATSGSNCLSVMLSGTNICFQLFSTNGTVIGKTINIGSGLSFPLVAYGGGEYLAYWHDDFIDLGGVYGQIISSAGNVVGSPFAIGMPGTSGSGLGIPLALASDGTNFLAVFQFNIGSIYGQVITTAGTTNSAFVINNQQPNGNFAAAVYGKTNYLVIWQIDNNDTGEDYQTYGEFITSIGSTGSLFQISQTASGDQGQEAIAFDGTNYLAVWQWDPDPEIYESVTNWDLYGRLVSQSGSLPGSELHLVTDPGSQYSPSLAFDGANYLLAWGNNPGGAELSSSTNYINLQFFNLSGSAIGPEFNLFPAQGTNVPAFVAIQSVGNTIAAAGMLGSPIFTDGFLNGFNSSSVFSAFIPVSTASPALTASNHTGTQFSLQLDGTPGINYAIQITTNLATSSWTPIFTNSPTNGILSFTDPNATNNYRLYRSVKQ